jgi:hypothetical protein
LGMGRMGWESGGHKSGAQWEVDSANRHRGSFLGRRAVAFPGQRHTDQP